ncbi:hypothetical protein EHQ53_08645 [Leptospira langatensis]|uniref:Lipoprotein n=1 Tax=Leptospira langatensis TaxID=2484983 RepID=A0A5F1ZVF6_9LEPT|nr:hypothetical protein [Leptospira langatensis]TGK01302.1 hypothetical protein EHO57_10225 [Leptospira langatensis]TGL42246.1 hypothetical protein EHQ53_08645 [Leptospira langatensis]
MFISSLNKKSLFILVLCLYNCIYNVQQKYPDLQMLKESSRIEPIKIDLHVDSLTIVNSKHSPSANATKYLNQRYESKMKEELEGSGFFLCVNNTAEAFYRIDLKVIKSIEQNTFLWLLSGFTLLIIPQYSDSDLSFQLSVIDSSGTKVAFIETNEHSSYVAELFLLFYMPFDYPWIIGKAKMQEERLIRNAIQDIILQIKKNKQV